MGNDSLAGRDGQDDVPSPTGATDGAERRNSQARARRTPPAAQPRLRASLVRAPRHIQDWPTRVRTGKHDLPPRPALRRRFHTETGGEILIVQYPGPNTGGRPVYDDRFNLKERRAIES